MATTTTRLLRASSPSSCHVGHSSSTCPSRSPKCFNPSGPWINSNGEIRSKLRAAAASDSSYFIAADPIRISRTVVGRGLVETVGAVFGLVLSVRNALVTVLRRPAVLKLKPRKFNVQVFMERAIIDCRFFTLFAVAGSLLGSVLCFLEGCHLVLESYLHYFKSLSGIPDQEHLMQLLIESIDMFMMGTALLIFGVGIYVMFVGTKSIPRWANMQSVTQAKSKIGHAILMILQVGLLDKLKHIPIVTCLDLACFGATILISSACIFLLSRLSGKRT